MKEKEIYLAGGCFWGTEHYFKQIEGVIETEVGFANGHTENPTYKEVYTDTTGYAETVHVRYNPDVVSLSFLLQMFFKAIDPTSLNKQGHDEGTRYRTGVYYIDPADLPVIEKVFAEEQKNYQQPLAVEKLPLQNFYTAEEYHQDYLDKNPEGYCHLPLSLFEFAKQAKEKKMMDQIIAFNKEFVAQKGYEKYITDKYPDKKLAVLSCMDTRLTELLPAALGLKNGDAKIIKNAGGLVISAFDSAMRSLIVAIYELGVEEIMVVAHSHCGACHMSFDHFHHEMIARGVTDETLDTIQKCGIDLHHWLEGFKDTPESVRKTVETIKTHPLVPKDIVVRGFIIDSETGELEEIR